MDVVDEHEAKAAKSGILALQIHVGAPMTVQFKNIRIKSLASPRAGDLETMKGKWVAVEGIMNGLAIPADGLEKILLAIEGNTYKFEASDFNEAGKFKLDEARQPKTMDVTPEKGPDLRKAIYSIDGDIMRVCYETEGAERPAKFESPADSKMLLMTYKRKTN